MRGLIGVITWILGWNGPPSPPSAGDLPSLSHNEHALPRPIDSFIEEFRQRYGIQSIGLATVQKSKNDDDESSWVSAYGAFGVADAKGNPTTERSMYGIASNSKFFASISVGLLIEDGTKLRNGQKLGYDTKMKDIFPEWNMSDPIANDLVDVTDLLAMRSGMPRHDAATGLVPPDGLIRDWELVRSSVEVRQAFQYNNWHYAILSHIIPTLTGKTYVDFVQERIFDPLGMQDATYNVTAAKESGHRTDGYMRSGWNFTVCGEQWDTKGSVDLDCLGTNKPFGWYTEGDGLDLAGPGGVILSVRDMVTWLTELLDPKVLPKSVIDNAGHPRSVMPTKLFPELGIQTYGFGQMQWTYRGHHIIGHTGSIPGQKSILIRLVDDDFGVMLATNEEVFGISAVYSIPYRILDDYLGLEPIDWDTRYTEEFVQTVTAYHPKPEEPVSPPPPTDIEGEYSHPVYGKLQLTSFKIPQVDMWDSVMGLEQHGTAEIVYVSPFEKLFSSHLVFIPFSGRVFNWTAVLAGPVLDENGQPTSEFVGGADGAGSAYIDEHGIGMFGNFWGAGEAVPVVHADLEMKDVEQRAEVWYAKLPQ